MSEVKCVLCGAEVTSKNPEKYPYCSNCHYTGRAAEHVLSEQIAWFEKQLPEDWYVRVDHTGGGCFWMAFQPPNHEEHGFYWALTDGDAGLPGMADPPIRGGWGYVGRHSDNEDSPDYEGTALFWKYEIDGPGLPPIGDQRAVDMILNDYRIQVELNYTVCALCWHFIEPNPSRDDRPEGRAEALGLAEFVHSDDGEQDHDHDARTGWRSATLPEWKRDYPALFTEFSDGKIGPNSNTQAFKDAIALDQLALPLTADEWGSANDFIEDAARVIRQTGRLA